MTIAIETLHFKSLSYTGQVSGPSLVVTGAVHGNETCGTEATLRVIDDIESKRLAIGAGKVTFVPVANPLAYAKGERSGERNLNRNLSPTGNPVDFEDRVANWLCPLLAGHEVLLDLHSTQARNGAFCMLGPGDNDGPLQPFRHAARERALALRLGVHRFVDGWLDTYAMGVERRLQRIGNPASRADVLNTDPRYGVGTTEYMRSRGGCALTLECGQHDDPDSPEVGYRAIVNALVHLGLSRGSSPRPVEEFEYLSLSEVTDRLHEGDTFSQEWRGFDRVSRGDLIGTRHDGTRIEAEFDGFILFPNPKSLPGNEWFYLARLRAPGELLPLT